MSLLPEKEDAIFNCYASTSMTKEEVCLDYGVSLYYLESIIKRGDEELKTIPKDLFNLKFRLSTPNIFRHIEGEEITLEVTAQDKEEASNKFYEYLMEELNYQPEIIGIKEIL
jgi:hypothetical protein